MLRAALQAVGILLLLSTALFLSAGSLDWPMAWAFLLAYLGFAVFLYPGTLITCGLDRRFAWSPLIPECATLTALGVFVAGYAFALWAMVENPFFATVGRIQSERGHRLVDRGPYRLVRHPGYAGAIVAHLALPIALGSLWGLLPAVLGSFLLAARTAWEEQTLERGLAGYGEYTLRVRWRLLPGIW